MASQERLENFYTRKYKKLLIVPIILIILSITILGFKYSQEGQFIDKDVTLTGGISATVQYTEDINIDDLRSFIASKAPNSDVDARRITDFSTGEQLGFTVEASKITSIELKPILEEYLNKELTQEQYSAQETGSSLGASFFREMIYAILLAFILMAITVFITFRKPIPSLAVILSAILDLTATLAIVSLFNIKLSTAGIAAFLMVIGYSIDTDVMLTTRVLKRTGPNFEKTYGAFKTGLTMTITTISALTIALIFTNSPILQQMFSIILIALFIDIISTWLMNAPLLTWYVSKNEIKSN